MRSFDKDGVRKIQDHVRSLFDAMSDKFREHLMHSLFLSHDKLEDYLEKNIELKGDALKDALSHLESLLSRIEACAEEKQRGPFMSYDEWVDKEYEAYKKALKNDIEAIQRLVGEGGAVDPDKTSPVDVMANDSVSHYNHLKTEYDAVQARSDEAIRLIHSEDYKKLKSETGRMQEAVEQDISRHSFR